MNALWPSSDTISSRPTKPGHKPIRNRNVHRAASIDDPQILHAIRNAFQRFDRTGAVDAVTPHGDGGQPLWRVAWRSDRFDAGWPVLQTASCADVMADIAARRSRC
jgi:hypothetical protein